MSKHKHTPGPWTAFRTEVWGDEERKDIVNTHRARASYTYFAPTTNPSDEEYANACLIAEAPAMLEMLIIAMETILKLADTPERYKTVGPVVAAMDSTILQAKGEEP